MTGAGAMRGSLRALNQSLSSQVPPCCPLGFQGFSISCTRGIVHACRPLAIDASSRSSMQIALYTDVLGWCGAYYAHTDLSNGPTSSS